LCLWASPPDTKPVLLLNTVSIRKVKGMAKIAKSNQKPKTNLGYFVVKRPILSNKAQPL